LGEFRFRPEIPIGDADVACVQSHDRSALRERKIPGVPVIVVLGLFALYRSLLPLLQVSFDTFVYLR
jgi:hypothetical protein